MCKELGIEFLDLESLCSIQNNRGTSKDRFRSKEHKKIQKPIDLLMKKEPKVMEIFVCCTCKEFGHFSSRCPKRVIKYRKISLSNED